MEAPERGNKAESEIGSKLDSPNDEVILQTKQKFLDIDKVSSGDKNPIEMAMNSARSEISSGVGVFQYDSKGPELAISPEIKKPKLDKVDDEPEEEEKIYYRGRGLQKDMKKTNIPKEYSRSNGVAITPNMFKIESSLGKGAFGKVFLVTMKENGKEYAMKVLSKAEIIKSKITRYAVTEKNVMSRISHPFIVGLNYAFQTDDLLYLILDY
jgi:serine/threonine protein kinase